MRKLVLPAAICLIATGFSPAWSQGKPPPLGVELLLPDWVVGVVRFGVQASYGLAK